MTLITFAVNCGTSVPVLMWLVAMGCDTAIIITLLLVKGIT